MPEQLRRPVADTLRRLATGHPSFNIPEADRLDLAETIASLDAWGHLPAMPDHQAPTLALFGKSTPLARVPGPGAFDV